MSTTQQSQRRVFLVTGANKGIGYEVVKKLSANHPNDLILLGCRDRNRGEDAINRLGSPSNTKVLVLDTTSPQSIQQAKTEILQHYGGHLDVLVNNAAIFLFGTDLKSLQDTFNTNYFGVKQMNDAMFPLIRDNGRIVNVSSGLGGQQLKQCPQQLKDKFLDANLTEDQLGNLFKPLFKAVEQGKDPKTVGLAHSNPIITFYGASKLGVNMLTRLEARDWNTKYKSRNVIISAVCPDYCSTDMNSNSKDGRPAHLGADSILHAVYDQNLESGKFWRDGKPLALELE